MRLPKLFQEYQADPRVYRHLKIGFACLIVAGTILIAFAVSPTLRQKIGIGEAHSVPQTHRVHKHHHRHHRVHGHHRSLKHQRSESSLPQGSPENVHFTPRHHHKKTSGVTGNSGGSHRHRHHHKPPPPPIFVPPAPESSASNTPGNSSNSKGKGSTKAKVEAELEVELPPVAEEATHGVTEGGGVTNAVNNSVGTVPHETPVQVAAPRVCLPNC